MKLTLNKKRIVFSVILLLVLLSLIFFNFNSYIIENEFNYFELILSVLASTISCFVLAIKIEFSRKVNIIYTVISIILSILFSYIIIELLNQNSLFSIYPKRLIFNFIVIIMLHLFIYSITNKANLTIILCNSIIFILGIVNYTVTCFRGTPLVPWDILSLKTAAYVASSYTFSFNYYFLLSVSLFVLIISIGTKVKYIFKKGKFNLALRIISLVTILALTYIFYNSNIIDYFDFENNLWKPKDEYLNNGFLASFVKQSKNLFNSAPGNYTSDNVKGILSNLQIQEETIPVFNYTSEEPNPNIIVIMNESYSDLSVNRKF